MHGKSHCVINKKAIDSSCPRCSETEDWDHIVKFRCVERKKDECLTKLRIRLIKADDTDEYLIKK